MISDYPPYASKSNLIIKAGSYARADSLTSLYLLCENQKTVSTHKLEKMLDYMADNLKLDAMFLRKIADKFPNDT